MLFRMEIKQQFIVTMKNTPLKLKTVPLALGNPNMLKNSVVNEMLGSLRKTEISLYIQYHKRREAGQYFWGTS